MPRSQRKHGVAGLTLVEVTIVMVVLVIAAALVAPSLGSTAPSQLRSAAAMLAADLDRARVASITQGHDPCVLVIDVDQGRYHLARASDPDTPIAHATDGTDHVVTFGRGRARTLAGVTFAGVDHAPDNHVAFGPFGQLAGDDDIVITLACADRAITITVDAETGDATISGL